MSAKSRSRVVDQVAGDPADVAQGQVGPARRDEPGLLPDDEVVLVAVARVGRDEGERHVLAVGRGRDLEPDLLARRSAG